MQVALPGSAAARDQDADGVPCSRSSGRRTQPVIPGYVRVNGFFIGIAALQEPLVGLHVPGPGANSRETFREWKNRTRPGRTNMNGYMQMSPWTFGKFVSPFVAGSKTSTARTTPLKIVGAPPASEPELMSGGATGEAARPTERLAMTAERSTSTNHHGHRMADGETCNAPSTHPTDERS